jgi:hypothetical protein
MFKTNKYLYGTFYIPPNSNAQVWEDIEQSIDLALTCNIDIIVTGDFNVNMPGIIISLSLTRGVSQLSVKERISWHMNSAEIRSSLGTIL